MALPIPGESPRNEGGTSGGATNGGTGGRTGPDSLGNGIPAPPPSAAMGPPVPIVWGTSLAPGRVLSMFNQRQGRKAEVNLDILDCDAADVVIGFCEAPVSSVLNVRRGRDVFSSDPTMPRQLVVTQYTSLVGPTPPTDPTLELGSQEFQLGATPAAWATYATPTATPAAGMGHQGVAQYRAKGLALLDKSIPDLSFEVKGALAGTDGDAHPADVLVDIVTHAVRGCGLPASMVEVDVGPDGLSSSGYRTYCTAMGFRVSRCVAEQTEAKNLLGDLLEATNSTIVWSGGKLKAIPLADAAIGTYSPPTTAAVIDDDEILHEEGSDSAVLVEITPDEEVVNAVPVRCKPRATEYETDLQEFIDRAHAAEIDPMTGAARGVRRAPVVTNEWIASPAHAKTISSLLVARSINVRTRYRFALGPRWGLLEPGDVISLSHGMLGISGVLCRILSIDDNEDGTRFIEAAEWPAGTAVSVDLTPQTRDGLNETALQQYYPWASSKGAQADADAAASAASAAQTDATSALTKLTDIASDALLTPGEKPDLIREKAEIDGEYGGIEAAGTTFGNTTQRTAYVNAKSALDTYLAGLTSPVAWNVTSGNTTIVAATFRQKFVDYYTTRQTLLNANADKARSNAATAQSTADGKANPNLSNVTPGSVTESLTESSVAMGITRSQNALSQSSDGERFWYSGNRSSVNAGLPVLMDKAWTASHAYGVGYRVLNSGNVYVCAVAGTSASSGGPTGTGTSIVDGSARWNYVGTMASQERIQVASLLGHYLVGNGYYTYALTLKLQPRTINDNLDGARFADVLIFNPTTANWVDTFSVALPDRRYGSPLTDSDDANSVTVSVRGVGGQCAAYASGYLNAFVRVIVYNSLGSSARDFKTNDGGLSTSATGGVTITGSGSPPPAPPPPPPDDPPVGGDCVAPETLIRTPNGDSLPAGSIAVGDLVWTIPEGGDGFGAYALTKAETYPDRERVRVVFEDGRAVTTSPKHRWLAAGEWRESQSLPPGIRVGGIPGGVVSRVEPASTGPIVLLTVDAARTYVADGLLCHNAKRVR